MGNSHRYRESGEFISLRFIRIGGIQAVAGPILDFINHSAAQTERTGDRNCNSNSLDAGFGVYTGDRNKVLEIKPFFIYKNRSYSIHHSCIHSCNALLFQYLRWSRLCTCRGSSRNSSLENCSRSHPQLVEFAGGNRLVYFLTPFGRLMKHTTIPFPRRLVEQYVRPFWQFSATAKDAKIAKVGKMSFML